MRAIITGASQGIGRALVEKWAKEGFDLIFVARNQKALSDLEHDLRIRYPQQNFTSYAVDMEKEDEIKSWADQVKSTHTSLDVLINNAGVFLPAGVSDLEQSDSFHRMMQLNVNSVYYTTAQFLPLMYAQSKGHIFNMCSIASFMPYGAYAVSKHALLGYSRVLREENKKKGVKVTAVMPGATWTPSWEGSGFSEDKFMTVEDIADLIWSCYQLGPNAVVEELIVRPMEGDL